MNGDSLKKMCELNGENTDVLEKGARGGGGVINEVLILHKDIKKIKSG